jgi:glycosyltransferase involved in cell wall biosynthesis
MTALDNTMQPLVSIAMCTYNGEKYLTQQIDSLLQQTYTNIEIVITDDASADHTIKILQEYAQQHSRIKFFVNEKNIGYNKNFERAITLCSGAYIAISDQDDIWEADKIAVMMQQWPAQSQFIYSLSGNFTDADFAGRTAAPNVVYTDVDDVHKLVFNSPVHGHACMFKKELMDMCTPFPENIFYDWWISMHAATAGVIGCVPQTLTWHRHHSANSSRTITSIKDEEERNKQLREQSVYFIKTFCSRKLLPPQQEASLLHYAALLQQMDGKTFNRQMFSYVLKNRKLVFHYKKPKAFLFISYLKHALKMARKGLL